MYLIHTILSHISPPIWVSFYVYLFTFFSPHFYIFLSAFVFLFFFFLVHIIMCALDCVILLFVSVIQNQEIFTFPHTLFFILLFWFFIIQFENHLFSFARSKCWQSISNNAPWKITNKKLFFQIFLFLLFLLSFL